MEGCLGVVVVLVSAALLVLPVISFFLSMQTRGRMTLLERELRGVRDELARLRVAARHAGAAEPSIAPEPQAAPASDSARTPEPQPEPQPEPVPVREPEPEHVPEKLAVAEPAPEPVAAYTATLVPTSPAYPPEPAPGPEREPEPAAIEQLAQAPLEEVAPAPAPPAQEPQPRAAFEQTLPPPSAPHVTPHAVPSRKGFDWEGLVGVKLFSWIAGVALALAAVFALKLGIEAGIFTPPWRLALGLITGIGLLVLCELKLAGEFRTTANAMDGAGIAILYATLFAAHGRWHLVPQGVAFALMVVVTAVAVILSIRRDSVFIALLGLVGGFATPALLSTGEDHPFSLFGYLLMLNAGIAWIAYRKRWPLLSLLTLLFTTIYQWVWVGKFLDPARLEIAIGIFLAFPLLTVMALWIASRDTEAPPGKVFEWTSQLSALLPLIFAFYGAAVPAYGTRFTLLFFFLFCVSAGLAAIAGFGKAPGLLHLLGGISTVLVFGIWAEGSWTPDAWPSILWWLAAFVLLYAAVPEIFERLGLPMTGAARRASYAAPLLLFMWPVLIDIEPRAAEPALTFGLLFALVAIVAGFAIRYESGGLYGVAGVMAFLAQAQWSDKNLEPATLVEGLVIYGAFTALFVAAPVIASRLGRKLGTSGAAPLPLLLVMVLLLFATQSSLADDALWGLAIVLAGAYAGLVIFAGARRRFLALTVGALLAWIVLGAWWSGATLTVTGTDALIVVVAFSAIVAAGGLWLNRDGEPGRDLSIYLSLLGYGFIFYAATQQALAVPPWPLLIALGVLSLLVAAGALAARRPSLQLGGVILGHVGLMVWIDTARELPWTSIAIVSAAVLAALALVAMRVARGRGDELFGRFALAAAASLFLAHFVAIEAAAMNGRPEIALVLAAHAVFLIATLGIAWRMEWHWLSIVAVFPSTIAYYAWRGDVRDSSRWGEEMVLATVLYLIVVAYPYALGKRAKTFIEPYLAAVVASVAYFFFAKRGLEWIGFNAMGLLPVAQAGLMLLLLDRVARIEPPAERTLGRLALVAAAVLGFVTVAIPLQLDREWVTIGWALEGAALIWLLRKIPHWGLLAWSTALLAAVFVRLALNPAVLDYHARSAVAIFNWYLYTYLVPAAALFVAAWLAVKLEDESAWLKRYAVACNAAGAILVFIVLNIEIADYFSKGEHITFNFSAGLAQDLTYTLGWAIYAIAMLVVGLIVRSRAARIASLGLLLVAVFKGFLHDLMRLGGLYRVGSLVGLAIALALVAVLLQKFVLSRKEEEA